MIYLLYIAQNDDSGSTIFDDEGILWGFIMEVTTRTILLFQLI
jgi:hypothetical protein